VLNNARELLRLISDKYRNGIPDIQSIHDDIKVKFGDLTFETSDANKMREELKRVINEIHQNKMLLSQSKKKKT